ncbi:T6SS immunity protein Tdi1 domain-containing protein [Sphingomonas sp. GlSt437]|uniref:T6SS immunity protein Tdi1 domain-containing protein n=1 Tax=Sphingomonas sp. GlSt437 TaxID=3389970 RepID=UPI003A8B406F
MLYLDGAYRRHRNEDVVRFTKLAIDAFPELAGRIECFGADWLGRQFAIDHHRLADGMPQVVMLEPGTGEALEIPVDKRAFHEEELAEDPDAAAAYSFFVQWLKSGGTKPGFNQCVGYKMPLYLGGLDDLSNLELGDLDVYWSISAQLLAKSRGLRIGTTIGNVSISG